MTGLLREKKNPGAFAPGVSIKRVQQLLTKLRVEALTIAILQPV
jgi:hypothetical protein